MKVGIKKNSVKVSVGSADIRSLNPSYIQTDGTTH